MFPDECDPCDYFSIGAESGEIKTGRDWNLIEDIDEVQLTIIAYDLAEGGMSKSTYSLVMPQKAYSVCLQNWNILKVKHLQFLHF